MLRWLTKSQGQNNATKSLADCLARHGLAQNLKNAAKGQINLNKIVYLNQIRYGCLMNQQEKNILSYGMQKRVENFCDTSDCPQRHNENITCKSREIKGELGDVEMKDVPKLIWLKEANQQITKPQTSGPRRSSGILD